MSTIEQQLRDALDAERADVAPTMDRWDAIRQEGRRQRRHARLLRGGAILTAAIVLLAAIVSLMSGSLVLDLVITNAFARSDDLMTGFSRCTLNSDVATHPLS